MFLFCFAVLPNPVFNVSVTERRSNKLLLSWSPGQDGFSPLSKCHIRVSLMSERTERSFIVLSVITRSPIHLRWKKWVVGKGRWPPPDTSTSQCRLFIVKFPDCRLWRGTTWVFPAAMRWGLLLSARGSRATPQREVCGWKYLQFYFFLVSCWYSCSSGASYMGKLNGKIK